MGATVGGYACPFRGRLFGVMFCGCWPECVGPLRWGNRKGCGGGEGNLCSMMVGILGLWDIEGNDAFYCRSHAAPERSRMWKSVRIRDVNNPPQKHLTIADRSAPIEAEVRDGLSSVQTFARHVEVCWLNHCGRHIVFLRRDRTIIRAAWV